MAKSEKFTEKQAKRDLYRDGSRETKTMNSPMETDESKRSSRPAERKKDDACHPGRQRADRVFDKKHQRNVGRHKFFVHRQNKCITNTFQLKLLDYFVNQMNVR